ncbi:hypothetical protein RhiXN_11604 [Rhizoctonia solani]|uniref:Uncharacterized protein n=1 Tax=Rhizoctonia solani TaxID=456999 RepID=A0A8H8P6Z4_9AGAM|nr:uncharacterized protein RhiXN_11604 [Rhizoctonia solani]QRW24692.1 hypothetical protein RhiXN_11604 [Rhizoctonia solani]
MGQLSWEALLATELAVSEWHRPGQPDQRSNHAGAYRRNYSNKLQVGDRRKRLLTTCDLRRQAYRAEQYKGFSRRFDRQINRYRTFSHRQKERPTDRSRASTAPQSKALVEGVSLYREPTTVGFARLQVCAQRLRVRKGGD